MSASLSSIENDGTGGLEDPLDFLARPVLRGDPTVAPALVQASAEQPSPPLAASLDAAIDNDDDDDVVPTSDPEEAAVKAARSPKRKATATQAERWARELAYWETAGRRGNGLASRFPNAFVPTNSLAGPSSLVASSPWRGTSACSNAAISLALILASPSSHHLSRRLIGRLRAPVDACALGPPGTPRDASAAASDSFPWQKLHAGVASIELRPQSFRRLDSGREG